MMDIGYDLNDNLWQERWPRSRFAEERALHYRTPFAGLVRSRKFRVHMKNANHGFGRFLSGLLVLLFSAVTVSSQTPEQVVTAYFEKLKSGGINTVAGLMHPEELRKFREMLTPVVEG